MRFLGHSGLFGAGHAAWIGFGAFFLLGNLVFSALRNGPPTVQPIVFNHSTHVGSGIACTDCHTGAESEARATLPAISTCLTCHESALTESAEEAKIRKTAAAGQGLHWMQLTRVPPHVYFSHRRHVQLAHLSCENCHGPMKDATAPPMRPFRQFTMSTCIDCHEQRGLKTDCNDCHR